MNRYNKILALLMLLSCCVQGQEIPRIFNFFPENYHAQRQNWSADQSGDRLMYFANNGGLLEYDGSHWQTYLLPNKSTVRSVVCQGDRVFCGGFEEFGYWKKQKHGPMKYYSLKDSLQGESINKEEIWHIIATRDRVLFQSFSTIYEYDGRKVVKYTPPDNIMFIQHVDGRLLFQVIGKGLCEFTETHTFRYIPGSSLFSDKIISAILPVSDGSGFRIYTLNHGIYNYDGQAFIPWQNATNELIKKFQINKAIRLSDGRTAIGTILEGLFLLGDNGDIQLHLNQQNGLQNNTVLNLKEDIAGNLWATLDKGICMTALRAPLTYYTDQIGKIGAVYTAALFEGNIYLGSNRGVFYKKINAPASEYTLVEGTQGQVWQLMATDGQLLCGHNEGTFRISQHRSTRLSSVTGGWKMILHPDIPNTIIQGTYTGLIVFRQDNTGKWYFSGRINGFLEPVKDIAFDKNGFLWAAHPNKGLYKIRLDAALSNIQEIRYFTRADGLPEDTDLHLMYSEQGSVRIQSDTVVLEERDQRLVRVRDLPVFPAAIQKYLPGKNGEWFGLTPNTVYYRHDGHTTHFEMRMIENYENIIILNEDIRLFCLEDGYALLNRQYLAKKSDETDVLPLIRSIEVIGNRDNDILNKPGKNGVYSMPAKLNDLHFVFAAPDYTRTPLFRYLLKGISSNWSAWSKETVKEFTNLPPGTYTLLVQSNLSDEVASMAFRIRPPWYLTWKGLLAAILLIGIFYQILRLTISQSLHRQRRRLLEENEAILEKQRIASANALLKTEIGGKNRELANSTMNLLRKNEMLNSIRDELLKMNEGNYTQSIRRLMRLIEEHNTTDHDWEIFEDSFNTVHENFIKRLKLQYPELTPGDLRLAAYLKMNISSKEIAQLLSISVRGVENKRYRLRKKMNLPDTENLTDFMINY